MSNLQAQYQSHVVRMRSINIRPLNYNKFNEIVTALVMQDFWNIVQQYQPEF